MQWKHCNISLLFAFNEKRATDPRSSNKSSHYINDFPCSRKTKTFNCR